MPTIPSRRERKKAKTRDRLLEAAMTNFATRGMTATRVEDVTESADVAKGAFYNYFDSKDALIAELVAHGVEILLERHIVPAVKDAAPPTPSGRARAALEAHARFFAEKPEFLLLFHQARGLLQLRERENARLHDVFEAYLKRVGDAVFGAGTSAPPEGKRVDAAAALVGALSGYLSFRVALGFEKSDARLAVDLAVAGLDAIA